MEDSILDLYPSLNPYKNEFLCFVPLNSGLAPLASDQSLSNSWERKSQTDSDNSWLALLLFDNDQQPESSIVTVADLKEASNSSPFWPGSKNTNGQLPQDQVRVIDVAKGTESTSLDMRTFAQGVYLVKTQIGPYFYVEKVTLNN